MTASIQTPPCHPYHNGLLIPSREPIADGSNQSGPDHSSGSNAKLVSKWARHSDEVLTAQRLRYQVFGVEMGAQLPNAQIGLDIDAFDAFCEHLLVIDETTGQTIGTYRVLTPSQAKRLGQTYIETEFDVSSLQTLLPQSIEVGRSCVHPNYRRGAVMMHLWAALAQLMTQNNWQYMMGCASVSIQDGGHHAANLWRHFQKTNMSIDEHSAHPIVSLPTQHLGSMPSDQTPDIPALLGAYLKMGCKILGAPAWDADFNCADFPIMLNLRDLPLRYRKHFLQG